MKRRERPEDADPRPLWLQRYDPADWPNPKCHPACAFWEAVGEWTDAHPIDLDEFSGAPVIADGPDVPWHPELI